MLDLWWRVSLSTCKTIVRDSQAQRDFFLDGVPGPRSPGGLRPCESHFLDPLKHETCVASKRFWVTYASRPTATPDPHERTLITGFPNTTTALLKSEEWSRTIG
jgi:hypothetical protein